MIMTADELRRHMHSEDDDQVLADKLQALEYAIRGYTNNTFTVQHTGRLADVVGSLFMLDEAADYQPGDTVQVTGVRNNGLYTVAEAAEASFSVKEKTYDDIDAYVVKVEYPMDVKMGVVALMKWEADRREKAGIQSETISRHSVTYADQTAENTVMGYPAALMGFLRPYMQARFGRGWRP